MFLSEKKNFIINESSEFKIEACLTKCTGTGKEKRPPTSKCMQDCSQKFDEASLFVIMKFLNVQKLL